MTQFLFIAFIFFSSFTLRADEVYFDWGYNRDYWSPCDIHIRQSSLGNDFVIEKVKAEDLALWDMGSNILFESITNPQWNFRLGTFFENDNGLELSFDHTKYTSILGQQAHVIGTIDHQYVDEIQTLDENYFYYRLHNGANHIMLSYMKRIPVVNGFTLIGKLGGGIMLPHSESTVLGKTSSTGPKNITNYLGVNKGWWHYGGWTTGVEIAMRWRFADKYFFEIADKEAYSYMDNIPVFEGLASQHVWMNEALFTFGYVLSE